MAPARMLPCCLFALCAALWTRQAAGADWPQFAGRDCRNMVSDEKDLPDSFVPGTKKEDGSGFDMATTRNVKWIARLGTQTHGNPTLLGGKILVGTNNGKPRNPRYKGDRGVVMCFDADTGKFLWHLVVSKLRQKRLLKPDNAFLGICSAAALEGGRAYLVTGRCAVVCLDLNGLANGNDGAFQDEGEYVALQKRTKPGKQDPSRPDKWKKPQRADVPLKPVPTDADIIWRLDMCEHLDIWPHNASSCSPILCGDLLFVNTGNGVDYTHKSHGSPDAPSIIALDKRTGKLVATDDANIGPGVFHSQWCSPSLGKVAGRTLLFFGGGDGVCYAFDTQPAAVPGKEAKVIKLVWSCDANPPAYRFKNGEALPYNEGPEGPSEIIGTPVLHNNRIYVAIGQDTTHGQGRGAVTCIDATLAGDPKSTHKIGTFNGLKTVTHDITKKGILWQYTDMKRSTATPAIVDGLVFVTDFAGDIHCLDAATGKRHWVHPSGAQTMCSVLAADGKLYVGNERGKFLILAASKEKKLIREIRLRDSVCCTPIVANGVIYIATYKYLYAVQKMPARAAK